MMVDLLGAIAQTPSLVVITYRPEYRGLLARMASSQLITLAPLDDSNTNLLVTQLLGADASVSGVRALLAQRAGGNPFFVEEMVRDLHERGVLRDPRVRIDSRAASSMRRCPPPSRPQSAHASTGSMLQRKKPSTRRP